MDCPMAPFSEDIRLEIRERAGHKSELSGRTDRPLQCSHYNHLKSYDDYNNKDNGLLVTDIEHRQFHVRFEGKAGGIGLYEHHNAYAIRMLGKRIVEHDIKVYGYVLDHTQDELEADLLWARLGF
jgi:hypothetical protein